MKNNLIKLALERIIELGQEAHSIHNDMGRWREKPYTDVEKTEKTLRLNGCLNNQRSWLEAIIESMEEEEE